MLKTLCCIKKRWLPMAWELQTKALVNARILRDCDWYKLIG
jgi:hypothetical protein